MHLAQMFFETLSLAKVLSKGSFAFSKDIGLFYGLNVYVPPKLVSGLKSVV